MGWDVYKLLYPQTGPDLLINRATANCGFPPQAPCTGLCEKHSVKMQLFKASAILCGNITLNVLYNIKTWALVCRQVQLAPTWQSVTEVRLRGQSRRHSHFKL